MLLPSLPLLLSLLANQDDLPQLSEPEEKASIAQLDGGEQSSTLIEQASPGQASRRKLNFPRATGQDRQVRVPAPPPEAVDACLRAAGGAPVPEGLNCDAVLEAVALSRIDSPEDRLLADNRYQSALLGGNQTFSTDDPELIAQRLRLGQVLGLTGTADGVAGQQLTVPQPVPDGVEVSGDNADAVSVQTRPGN
jgi:hypothetical protein